MESPFLDSVPKRAQGITRYQLAPDRWDNGDPSNDAITTPMDRSLVSGEFLDEYKKHTLLRTGDWFPLHDFEETIHQELITTSKLPDKVAYGSVLRYRWFGGDFAGIRKRMGYLQDLGVKGVFMNSVRLANTPMRYDVVDYRHVDPRLSSVKQDNHMTTGNTDRSWTNSDLDFMKLVNEFHEHGIKVVMDFAWVYSSTNSIFLEDVARHGKASPYYWWFEFYYKGEKDYITKTCRLGDYFSGAEYSEASNIRYNSWAGNCPMVLVRKDYDDTIHGDLQAWYKGIIERWLAPKTIDGVKYDGIDGVRLDAYPELPNKFKQDLYEYIKSFKPDALVDGEQRGTDARGIKNNQIDGISSYYAHTLAEALMINKGPKRYPLSRVFDSIKKEFSSSNLKYWGGIWNYIGSHDTDRIMSRLIGDNRTITPIVDVNDDYLFAEKAQYTWDSVPKNKIEGGAKYIQTPPNSGDYILRRSISQLLFMLPGSPVIYYGDEIGMRGSDDPDSRKPMRWSGMQFVPQTRCVTVGSGYCTFGPEKDIIKPNTNMLNDYKKLIELQKNNDTLRYGLVDADVSIRTSDDAEKKGLFAFARRWQGKSVYFVSNQVTPLKAVFTSIYVGSVFQKYYEPFLDKYFTSDRCGWLKIDNIPAEESRMLFEQ